MTEALYYEIVPCKQRPDSREVSKGFEYLTPVLQEALRAISISGSLAYVETEYFGGTGVQGAVAFKGGQLAYGPRTAEIGPINEALKCIGVEKGEEVDEFRKVGLHRFRGMEHFIEKGLVQDEIRDLMHKYRNFPMDLADACLVLLAESHPGATLFTTDRDFLAFRTRTSRPLRVLAPFYE